MINWVCIGQRIATFGFHRPVVRTSRCGRENASSILAGGSNSLFSSSSFLFHIQSIQKWLHLDKLIRIHSSAYIIRTIKTNNKNHQNISANEKHLRRLEFKFWSNQLKGFDEKIFLRDILVNLSFQLRNYFISQKIPRDEIQKHFQSIQRWKVHLDVGW